MVLRGIFVVLIFDRVLALITWVEKFVGGIFFITCVEANQKITKIARFTLGEY